MTTRHYAAFLRAIAHVPMQPFREAMEGLGFRDVASYGMSGNLVFNADEDDVALIEARIAHRQGAVTFVRTRRQLARVVAADPYASHPGAAVLFLAKAVPAKTRKAMAELNIEGAPPQIVGRTVFFTETTRLRGRSSLINLEHVLGIPGTARSSRVVAQVLARMSDEPRR